MTANVTSHATLGSRKNTPKYFLDNESSPPEDNPTTKSATIRDGESKAGPQIEDFLRRAHEAGIRVNEEGWEMAEKAQGVSGLKMEDEEWNDAEWVMLEDEGGIGA